MQNPSTNHFKVLTHTLNYVAHASRQVLLLKGSDALQLQAFWDSDQGACLDTRRSITRYVIHFGNSLVSWKSKKQHNVSKSSSEVEYRAMAVVASEITRLVRLLEEFGVVNLKPLTLQCDIQSAYTKHKTQFFIKEQNTSRQIDTSLVKKS